MKFKAGLSALIFFCASTAFGAHEMSFDKILSLPLEKSIEKTFDVSIYISQKSQWQEKEILSRLEEANKALSTCKLGMRHLYIYGWKPSNPKLRVDDYRSKKIFYDGLRHASFKSKKVTAVQLFYFEDYLNSFSSGPSLPLAVYPDPKLETEAYNTAWFPFKSAQRARQSGFKYNEEAHEIGHILLKQGHDHSGDFNILANDSKKRAAVFSKAQCEAIKKSEFLNPKPSDQFLPLLSAYYQNYSFDFYMSDWCSRNTINLAKDFDRHFSLAAHKAYAVYVLHKRKGTSFYPQKARDKNVGWKFHAFLVVDGFALDLDFGSKPEVVSLDKYLLEMFPDSLYDLQFQARSALDSPGFMYIDVRKSFDDENAKIFNAEELLNFIL